MKVSVVHNFQNQTSDFLVSNVFYIKGETSCSNFIMYVEALLILCLVLFIVHIGTLADMLLY
jgi:hypothetical protein